MDNHKELAAYPLDSNHLTDPRGADGVDRTDGARVYFVADAGSDTLYRYTIREDDQEHRQIWDDFLAAIRASNFTVARGYMHPASRNWFDKFIKRLGSNATTIPTKLSNGSNLKLKWITKDFAEFFVFITVDIFGTGPKYYAAEVRIMRDTNGNWKIESF
jgi:hypothetical protein